MWPNRIENLPTLSAEQREAALAEMGIDDLRAYAREIRLAGMAALADKPEADVIAEAALWSWHRAEVLAVLHAKQAEVALAASFSDDSEDPDEVDDPAEGEGEGAGEGEGEGAEGGEGELATVGAGAKPAKRGLGGGGDFQGGGDDKGGRKRVTAQGFSARDGISGKQAGEQFDDWSELIQGMIDRASNINPRSNEKFGVGVMRGQFDPDKILESPKPAFNLAKFDDEVMAAMCAPLRPVYDLDCRSVTRRPVGNSLPTFQPSDRGGVTIYPSPTLSDITTGYGVWTSTDDADPDAVKEACQTIACATPEEYRIYGLYRCLTVKNLLAMTFPELVEAYANKLAAMQSRLGDTRILEQMATGADAISAPTLGYNATTTITTTLLTYLTLYMEQERWDVNEAEAWLPRWLLGAIKIDVMRRRRTDGQRNLSISDAEVNRMFTDIGITPHWFIDTPSWGTGAGAIAAGGVLRRLPTEVEILVAPRGKFGLMDRGDLTIGVTGNNIYRDNTSNSRNEFTMFFESFEGVVNTNSCPAGLITIPGLCWNGVQVADVAINCEGGDYIGVGS